MKLPVPDILNALRGAAFVLEPGPRGDPVFTRCNPAWFDLLNRSPEDVYGKTIAEVVLGPAGEGALLQHRKSLTARGQVTYLISAPLARGFGKLRSTLTPFRDDGGNLICVLGTTEDIAPLRHDQIVEMRFESLAREIDAFTGFLSAHLLTQLEQVSQVASDLIDGFVDLGDGKLQTIEQIEQDAQKAASMVVEVLGRARATRSISDTDTFDISALVQSEADSLFGPGMWSTTSSDPIVMTDKEALRVVVRNILISTGREQEETAATLHIDVEIDSPGMLAVTLEAQAGHFDYAVSRYAAEHATSSPMSRALDTVISIVQQRSGEFFAERAEQSDMVQFTMPGYLLGGPVDMGTQNRAASS